jgi:hypothetical protein
MDSHDSSTTSPVEVEVDLDSTRSRLQLAREQCASQSSTAHLRSIGALRSWETAHRPRAEQPGR